MIPKFGSGDMEKSPLSVAKGGREDLNVASAVEKEVKKKG